MEEDTFLMKLDMVPAAIVIINQDGVVSHYNELANQMFHFKENKIKWPDLLKIMVKGGDGDAILFNNNKRVRLKTQSLPDKKGQLVLFLDDTQAHYYTKKIIHDIIYEDQKMKAVLSLAEQVSKTDASVMISGESGTGKEVIARFIHAHSPRREHPFMAINCAAIPENMLEAILFGYEKGAFTGALNTVEGKLEQGNRGTILLDEITEMPLMLQAKLLRVIQEKEVERLGGKKLIKLDIRIISTTNRILSKEVEAGSFRKDLYFRLNVFPLFIPPLRERREDIAALSHYFIKHFCLPHQQVALSKKALEKLLTYHWPGNVRELQNVIQRALITCQANEIREQDLSFESIPAEVMLEDELIDKENAFILKTLEENRGNRNVSAQKLGISERTLRNKLSRMRKMGIRVEI